MKRLALVVVAAAPSVALAADQPELEREVLVVASRREQFASSVTSAVEKFTDDDFQRRRPINVAEVIRETPGVYVASDGPPGQFSRVFLRGTLSTQTLVLVDGIPQNDATTGGGYDFNDLGMTGVESVEVLRGSYSVLYGSEAIGGVVNVTTRRGHGKLGGYAVAQYGSFGTRREEVGVSMGDRRVDWAFALGDSATRGEHEREAYAQHDAVGRFGVQLADALRFEASLRAAESRVESPVYFATMGVLPDDDDIGRRRQTTSGGGTLTWDAAEWLTVRATGSAFNVYSRFKNGPEDGTDGRDELDSRNTATDLRARLEATFTPLKQARGKRRTGVGFDGTVGGEYVDERSLSTTRSPTFGGPGYSTTRSDETTRTKSGFVQANLRLPDVAGGDDSTVVENSVLTAGVRTDRHSVFGRENSPYVGGRVDVLATTLRASYGEGFRAPKPSELFDPFVGDANLGPETSRSFDVGVSRRFADGDVVVGVTWFRLRVEDLIAFDNSTFKLKNLARTETTGFEYEAAVDLGGGFDARASATFQIPRDEDTGNSLANRPRRFGSAGVQWQDCGWRVSLDAFVSGSSPHQGGEFSAPDGDARRRPGHRVALDLTASFQATDTVRVFGGVRNLLNEDWVATPNSPGGLGIGVFAGVQLDF